LKKDGLLYSGAVPAGDRFSFDKRLHEYRVANPAIPQRFKAMPEKALHLSWFCRNLSH